MLLVATLITLPSLANRLGLLVLVYYWSLTHSLRERPETVSWCMPVVKMVIKNTMLNCSFEPASAWCETR